MEIVIALVLIIVAISNIAIFKGLQGLQSPPVEHFQTVNEVIGCDCKDGLSKEVEELRTLLDEKVNKPPSPPVPDESHFAWKNQKEEPNVAPKSPHGPPPAPGPLQRPYGFSR